VWSKSGNQPPAVRRKTKRKAGLWCVSHSQVAPLSEEKQGKARF